MFTNSNKDPETLTTPSQSQSVKNQKGCLPSALATPREGGVGGIGAAEVTGLRAEFLGLELEPADAHRHRLLHFHSSSASACVEPTPKNCHLQISPKNPPPLHHRFFPRFPPFSVFWSLPFASQLVMPPWAGKTGASAQLQVAGQ